jgi:hypothetical protein
MLHIGLAFLAGIAQGQSIPDPRDPEAVRCNLVSRVRGPDDPLLDRLKGTVEFFGACSASFVTLKNRSKSERGLVLTSGHCVERGTARLFGHFAVPAPGEILLNVKERRTFTLDTGTPAAPRACLKADELTYATMTGLDLAIYRLTETYEEIERRTGAKPLMIATDAQIPAGMRVRMPSAWHQRQTTCSMDRIVASVREVLWTLGPAMRLTRECDPRPGFSGSPVIREDTNEVIGVLSSGYVGDGVPCTIMNPCEIAEDGTVSIAAKGQGYAYLVHQLYTCRDQRGNFDLTAAGCQLPRPQRE